MKFVQKVCVFDTISKRNNPAYARLFKVAKTMQNELSMDPRGTLVVYNAPVRFTYWVPTCVWFIAGTIQMGKIYFVYTHPQLMCMHPYWASSLNFY